MAVLEAIRSKRRRKFIEEQVGAAKITGKPEGPDRPRGAVLAQRAEPASEQISNAYTGGTGSQLGKVGNIAGQAFANLATGGLVYGVTKLVEAVGKAKPFVAQVETRAESQGFEHAAFGVTSKSPFGTVGVGRASRTTAEIVQPFTKAAQAVDVTIARTISPDFFEQAKRAAAGFDVPIQSRDLGDDEIGTFALGRAKRILSGAGLSDVSRQITGGDLGSVIKSLTSLLQARFPQPAQVQFGGIRTERRRLLGSRTTGDNANIGFSLGSPARGSARLFGAS